MVGGHNASERWPGASVNISERLTSDERLAEIADILAAGLQRLLARQSTRKSADSGESSLDISTDRSVDPEDSAPEDAR